jgi:hypothetical protein
MGTERFHAKNNALISQRKKISVFIFSILNTCHAKRLPPPHAARGIRRPPEKKLKYKNHRALLLTEPGLGHKVTPWGELTPRGNMVHQGIER